MKYFCPEAGREGTRLCVYPPGTKNSLTKTIMCGNGVPTHKKGYPFLSLLIHRGVILLCPSVKVKCFFGVVQRFIGIHKFLKIFVTISCAKPKNGRGICIISPGFLQASPGKGENCRKHPRYSGSLKQISVCCAWQQSATMHCPVTSSLTPRMANEKCFIP